MKTRNIGLWLLVSGFVWQVAMAEPLFQTTQIDLDSKYAFTPLHLAARNGDVAEVRRRLQSAVELEARDFLGRTPLHLAVMWNRREIARLLLERGAEVNARDQWGVTPLRRVQLLEQARDVVRTEVADLLRAFGGQVDITRP